jgi:hyperosmotically inducible periplasmic protein
MKAKSAIMLLAIASLLMGMACTSQRTVSYKDSVQTALKQADLTDVTVREDLDKNTITLGGKVHSMEAKEKAGEVAKASAGNRIVANEISVEPMGVESQARDIASNVDEAIEKNYKAVLISKGLDDEHIRFDSKNAVLTLKGTVKDPSRREEAQQLARSVPYVEQVVNEIQVKR